MNESADLLRLRVLLCFFRSTPENCNVTGISRTLREEKYTISRMMAHLERDGLVDRTDNRRPILTEGGWHLLSATRNDQRLRSITCYTRVSIWRMLYAMPVIGRCIVRTN